MDMKETLIFYRRRQGLSQIDLADALAVSRQTISKWETDETLPDIRPGARAAPGDGSSSAGARRPPVETLLADAGRDCPV